MANKDVLFGKLRGKMVEEGITQSALAHSMGLSRATMSLKMNGKRDFTLTELKIIVKLLNIDDPYSYFFVS